MPINILAGVCGLQGAPMGYYGMEGIIMDMNMNIKGVQGYSGVFQQPAVKKPEFQETALTKNNGKSDVISISANGNFQAELNKEVKMAAESVVKTNTDNRVESIKAKVDAGAYAVSTGDVANAILARLL